MRRRVAWATAALVLLGGCEQTTVATVDVASVEITPDHATLVEGDRDTLLAVLRGSAGGVLSGRRVTWTSDDPSVADVDSDGVVEALAEGTTLVHATSEGVTGTATVEVLPAPAIGLSVEELRLEADSGDPAAAEGEVEVRNLGAGTLDGLQAQVLGAEGGEAAPPWLSAELLGDAAPTRLMILASASSLPPGTYRGRVRVSSSATGEADAEVRVVFEVEEAPPELRVRPETISLAAAPGAHTPASQSIEVINAGGGSLAPVSFSVRYSDHDGVDWLNVRVPAGWDGTGEVTIEASSRFLGAGEYSAIVQVSSATAWNERVEVVVSFVVGSGAAVELEAEGRGAHARDREEPRHPYAR